MLKPLDDDGGVVSISVEVRCLCGGLSRTFAAVLAGLSTLSRHVAAELVGLSSKVGLHSSWLDCALRFFKGLSMDDMRGDG